MCPFSIVVPVRGTPEEIASMERTVPSMVRLNPGEIMFATDAGPAGDRAAAEAMRVCSDLGFECRTISVQKSPEWGFQLARVLYTAYEASRHDAILRTDIDVVLRQAVTEGRTRIGAGGATCCSLARAPLSAGLGGRIRRHFYMRNARRKGGGFTGLHWIWRPHFFADIDRGDYRRIRNGEDAYLAAAAAKGHGLKCLPDVGGDNLGRVSDDYDNVQFQTGVWLAANLAAGISHGKEPRRAGAARSFAWTAALSAAYCRPLILRAWVWARTHRGHPAVKAAAGRKWEDWRCNIPEEMAGLRAWKDARP